MAMLRREGVPDPQWEEIDNVMENHTLRATK